MVQIANVEGVPSSAVTGRAACRAATSIICDSSSVPPWLRAPGVNLAELRDRGEVVCVRIAWWDPWQGEHQL
jgi:hypothetical protein